MHNRYKFNKISMMCWFMQYLCKELFNEFICIISTVFINIVFEKFKIRLAGMSLWVYSVNIKDYHVTDVTHLCLCDRCYTFLNLNIIQLKLY